jgi:hypothetical protein
MRLLIQLHYVSLRRTEHSKINTHILLLLFQADLLSTVQIYFSVFHKGCGS